MSQEKVDGTSRSWFRTTLGTVVTLINGRAYKQEEMLTEGTPILRIQNLNGGDRWFYSNLQLPPEKYCASGDLLYAWSATFGPYIYEGPRAIFHYHIWNVVPSAVIDKRFAYYELLRVTDQIRGSAHGVAMPHVTKGGMEAWPIDLPPMAEQKRIADKLDTVLTRVDAVNTRLARVAPLLKRFRQSVLAAATSGRLTEDWRGNEEPKWTRLVFSDTVVESSTGLVRSAADQSLMRDGLVPYLKMNSVGEMWGYHCVDLPGVECTSEELARYELKNGDWLFNTRNSVELVGKSCVWNGPVGVVFNNNLLRVRFKPRIHPMWIEIYFRSPTGRDLLNSVKSATTSVAAIYQRSLMDLQVVVPPFEEQTEIVRRVETLFAFADRLEARLAQAQTAATRLTPALLAKAFRGELVPQDPNDEPAAELLRRLQAQRTTGAPASKTGAGRGRGCKAAASAAANL